MSSIRVGIRRWSRTPRGHRVRDRLSATTIWLVPPIVIWAVFLAPTHVLSAQTALTGLVGLGILLAAAKRPDRSLLGLIVFLPFQGLVISKLWAWGVPTSVASHLGAWKETLALGVIVAGFRNFVATGRRADTVDRLALGFVLLVALYEVAQSRIIPEAPTTSSIRLLGFRETAGFVLVMLGARHAPLGTGFARRAERAVFITGAAVAAIGIYEAIFSSAWNHFVVHTMKYTAYQVEVLHGHPNNFKNILTYGTLGATRFVRVGSVFLDELNCGFYLILPFAVGLEKVVRRAAPPLTVAATVAIGAALLLTQTRSAILGGLIVAFLTLWPTAGRPRHWRTQAVLLLLGLALIAVPGAASTNVVKRFGQIGNSSNRTTAGHKSGFWRGVHAVTAHPLGEGLGTGAGIGERFTVQGDTVPENSYLNVGIQAGVLGMLLFAALTIAVILRLRRAARARSDPLVTAAFVASAGIAVTAWFLQTWLDFGVSWTFWGVAGAMLAPLPHAIRAADAAQPAMPSPAVEPARA